MTIKKTLTNIVLVGASALGGAGCLQYTQYQEGKVTKESGTIVNVVESSGALFGNESVKFGNPNYILTVETDQGEYIINVEEHYSKPLAALAEAIEVGDIIKFATGVEDGIKFKSNKTGTEYIIKFKKRYNYEGVAYGDYFSKDRIGNVPSHEIELLGK